MAASLAMVNQLTNPKCSIRNPLSDPDTESELKATMVDLAIVVALFKNI